MYKPLMIGMFCMLNGCSDRMQESGSNTSMPSSKQQRDDGNAIDNEQWPDNESLAMKIGHLRPWSGDGIMSPSDWRSYITVARQLQNESLDGAKAVITEYEALAEERGDSMINVESRLFLLLRVVFDLPEQAPESNRRLFIGWTNWPEVDRSGNVNMAWPVKWTNGVPSLMAKCHGRLGPPYDAIGEFSHFHRYYRLRKLANDG
jgi:hypothetical protein